jgi:acetolactate synthase I/II/III large subunit
VKAVVEDFVGFKGPAFLEVIIDPDAGVYPMVGPGMAYTEMITGDHIPSREPAPTKDVDKSEMF